MKKRIRKKENKAGYTATSCGRVGRGGNARFPTLQLERDGPTNGPTNGQTDKASYRVACPQLKNRKKKLSELANEKSFSEGGKNPRQTLIWKVAQMINKKVSKLH